MMMNANALLITDLSHAYGTRKALDHVSLSIGSGRFAVLLGLNGAGKSTLFSLITRLYAAQQGRIDIFGHNIAQHPGEALRLLGVVFQARTLDLDLSVLQNLLYHAALHGIGRREARTRAQAVLQKTALSDRMKDKVRNLSGGQMRRLEIARALLHGPQLLVLDEPTVGLDIDARADILQHVRNLVKEQSISVLWATHLIDEIAEHDDIIVLHHGRVMASGQIGDILRAGSATTIGAAFTNLTRAPSGAPRGEAA
jgi:ABC-2 type transport system ATP-binding protein